MELVIAYKNYSSWSLRPWLLMRVAGIDFNERLLPFAHNNDLKDFAAQHDLPARVPVLLDQKRVIWDSLAIAEYLAEQFPERALWPTDVTLRALARSASAEMHSGFMALRQTFPMNCRVQKQAAALVITDAVQRDLNRLAALWARFAAAKADHKDEGAFLCGAFSIVDAMYAPVMWRVRGYGLTVSDEYAAWSEAMYALPAMQEWLAAAQAETWSMPQYDQAGEQ
ncbi:glutathione S-transferase [Salinispirillum sp. LH 10-3-1]|uniref:Glutathione S-transferase n=1 Tax=Salinispirillum sp. LH 10-3-1 TaxID=2952525 RepID=A0AB38YGW6_9GAMM